MYIIKRVLLMIFTLWLVMTITFFAMSFLPGNPYPNSEKLKKEDIARLDHNYGFDRPKLVQYADYMTNITGFSGLITVPADYPDGTNPETAKPLPLFGFKFGESFVDKTDVTPKLLKAYGVSFNIGFMSLILGSIVGIILGLLAALKKNGPLDITATVIAVIGVSFPSFIFATLLQVYVAKALGLPSLFNGSMAAYILPVVSLSVFAIAQTARVTRTEMVEIMSSNFITLGRAKGVSNRKITMNYAFRNSMIAILTIFGPLMVSLTTGSLVVEKIFGIPGMGDLLTNGILAKDIYVVLGVTLFLSLQIMLMYLIVDLLYAVVDPRIRVGGKK